MLHFDYNDYETVCLDRTGALHYVMNEPFGWACLHPSRAYRREGAALLPCGDWEAFGDAAGAVPAPYMGRDALQVIALDYVRAWCEDNPGDAGDLLGLQDVAACHLLAFAPAAAVDDALKGLDWAASLQACGIDAI